MAAIQHLCSRALLFSHGRIIADGSMNAVVSSYLASDVDEHLTFNEHSRPEWAERWIRGARLLGTDGLPRNSFSLGEDIVVEMEVVPPEGRHTRCPAMGVVISHVLRGVVGGINTRMTGYQPRAGEWTGATFRCVLSRPNFLQGVYTIDLWFGDGPSDLDVLYRACQVTIHECDVYETGVTPLSELGVVFLKGQWSFEANEKFVRP